MALSKIPFDKEHELNMSIPLDHIPFNATLPGYPNIHLRDTEQVQKFLKRQFRSRDLETMAPRLWWMSMHDSRSISPLHRQRVKGREIVITEDPKLHLVWIFSRIFVKPLPEFLMSWAIWEQFIVPPERNGRILSSSTADTVLSKKSEAVEPEEITLRDAIHDEDAEMLYRSAIGYLRTYLYLIQHESDFHIAQELRLLPKRLTWDDFCIFTSQFASIDDSRVSERYEYGEIRLTRLNFYGKFFLKKRYFQRVEYQYGHYFARFYAPLLFIFGIASVLLSALQVEVTVEQSQLVMPWRSFQLASRGLSIAALVGVAVVVCVLIFLFCEKFGREWIHALQDQRRRKRAGTVARARTLDTERSVSLTV